MCTKFGEMSLCFVKVYFVVYKKFNIQFHNMNFHDMKLGEDGNMCMYITWYQFHMILLSSKNF